MLFVVCLSMTPFLAAVRARPDLETRERFYGSLVAASTPNASNEGSIADIFDRVLEKEFSSENDSPKGHDANSFNSTVADNQVGCCGDSGFDYS